jgi:hypothetical protein
MKTFQEYLRFKEEQGLFGPPTTTGDTFKSYKDANLEPDKGYPNSGFWKGAGGGGGASTPATAPKMKKMKKDVEYSGDGGQDATGMYTGTLSGGLAHASPVRMKKK